MDDDVTTRPSYYRRGGYECRDVEAALLADSGVPPMVAHLWADAFEYLWRWDLKGGSYDLRKAWRCLDEMLGMVEAREGRAD